MTVIRFMFLILGLSYTSALMHENVFFHKVGQFSVSRSRWLVSFVIDLGIYEQFLDKLSGDIENAFDIASQLISYHRNVRPNANGRDYASLFASMKSEIQVIFEIHNDIKESFKEYKLLSNDYTSTQSKRSKRRVFGFVGDLMHTIFGTLTEDDLSSVKRNVKRLAESQLDLSHALQESISIVNMSRIDIRENRQKINDVIKSLKSLNDMIVGVSELLESRLSDLEQIIMVFTKFDLVIDEIRNALSRSMYFYLHLQIQIQSITRHSLSPSTIPAKYFREILLSVQERLPKTIGLPLDPRKHLFEYYQSLQCIPIFYGNRIVVTTTIPLVEYTQGYDIFRAHSLPVPLLGTEVANNRKELLASYKLEAKYIAISTDRAKYILLPDQQSLPCNNPIFNICNIKEPVRNVNIDKSCILANFKQDKYKVKNYCNVWIEYLVLPTALYLTNDVYLVITNAPLVFHVSCKDQQARERISIEEPYGFLTIQKQCKAVSNDFELIGYFENSTIKPVKDPASLMLKDYNFTDFKVWDQIKMLEPIRNRTVSIPDELAEMKEFPLNILIDKLNHFQPMEDMSVKPFPIWGYVIIVVGTILIAFTILCLYCKCEKSKLLRLIITARNKNHKRNMKVLPKLTLVEKADNNQPNSEETEAVMSTLLKRDEVDTSTKLEPTLESPIMKPKPQTLDTMEGVEVGHGKPTFPTLNALTRSCAGYGRLTPQ